MDTVLITGITGQCAGYLAEQLLESNKVVGVKRRSSTNNTERIKGILDHPNFTLVEGEITDPSSIFSLLTKFEPAKIFNTAAQSHVHTSFHEPSHSMDVTGKGVLNILEGIRLINPSIKFLQFSTSEMFGKEVEDDGSQNENTRMVPQSPYAIAKLAGYHYTRLYRESYGLFSSNMITFNMESSRRGEEFVTRKITKWIGEYVRWRENVFLLKKNVLGPAFEPDDIIMGKYRFPKLRLGNITTYRDWGYVPDYMGAAIKILGHNEPDDFVVATGKTHTVEDFLREAFSVIGIENYKDYFVIDPKFYRPAEVPYLKGDARKIKQIIGWEPKTTFRELVRKMVRADIEEANQS